MNSKHNKDAINVVVEGGTDYNNHMVAMVASKALHDAGFTNASRVYKPNGSEESQQLVNTDRYVPSVLDVIRNYDPEVFATPIVIAAHDPKPYPMERRRFDRPLLQAENIAAALSNIEDPDDVWEQLNEGAKHRLVRELRSS